MSEHTECLPAAEQAANQAFGDDLAGQMRATEGWPAVFVSRYLPELFTCPHGINVWVWPDSDRIAALDSLGAES